MTSVDSVDLSFYSAIQYFAPKLARKYTAPLNVPLAKIWLFCESRWLDQLVPSPLHVLSVAQRYLGGAGCEASAFSLTVPDSICDNFWGKLSRTGCMYFEYVSIRRNDLYEIRGDWSLPALVITLQIKSE